jgi:hypothetical protein
MSTIYLRGYWKGSKNGRIVTIGYILINFPTISQLKGKKILKNSLNRQIKEGFLELWKNQMKQYSEGKLPCSKGEIEFHLLPLLSCTAHTTFGVEGYPGIYHAVSICRR